MSNRRKVTIAILAVIVVAVAIWALVPVQPVELKVTISLDSATFREGGPILLHATVTNESEKPVKILEPSLADMTFEVGVFDSGGSRRDYLGPYGLKKMDRNAGRYLEPGQTASMEIPLHESFELPAGEYRVEAAYRTLNYPDVDVSFCRIPSNQLSFAVLSSDQQSER